eukprot:6150962-Pleurochrysis_carterae.AAC.1
MQAGAYPAQRVRHVLGPTGDAKQRHVHVGAAQMEPCAEEGHEARVMRTGACHDGACVQARACVRAQASG